MVSPFESVAVSAAARSPASFGVNSTLTVQLASAASAPVQVVPAIVKSPAANSEESPEIGTRETVIPVTALLAFKVNVSALLAPPTASLQ